MLNMGVLVHCCQVFKQLLSAFLVLFLSLVCFYSECVPNVYLGIIGALIHLAIA